MFGFLNEMAEIQAAFTQSAPLETRESVPYLNDLIFFLKRKVEMFQGIRGSTSSSELQNFRLPWQMVLSHPSRTPGRPEHLGNPGDCLIQRDS